MPPDSTPAVQHEPKKLQRWFRPASHPAQLIVFSFLLVIAAGTLLLSLPAATTGERLTLVDAFFTAASATCVTGLVVVDTGTVLSRFGQIVVLACLQIGGLGLMTLTTVFMVVMGHRLAIADRIAIQESYHHTPTGKLRTLVFYIVVATFITEAAGAVLLFARWSYSGQFATWTERIYHSIFHAVSAFCNAGFALYTDSLTRFQNDWITQTIVTGLIVSGGVGFLVSLDVKEYLQQRWFRGLWTRTMRDRIEARRPRPRLSVHSKFVLVVTGVLLIVGTVSYFVLERDRLFGEMTPGQAWLNSWFCAVTARTAGFNTIDYSGMSGAALLCTMVLMLIGASPGSTGGGVKTSTFGVLFAYAIFRWRGHERLNAFGRTIPQETIDRAHSIVVTAVAVVVLAASFLMTTETYTYSYTESQQRFLPVLFETVSAFGTVGLSMGITPTLSVTGKLVIAVVMFIGRIGPLTIAVAVATRSRRGDYRYAEENLMVG
jgi:trk system potassium uptake protein TrkH